MEKVILVDKKDNEMGLEEKIKAHQEGKLHRAFSVFVLNSKNELLLQQRAKEKYHCGGLWSNTCCSHPRPNESVEKAAHRKLKQEMGFDCKLKEILHFVYYVDFGNGLREHEYDHVLIGRYDKPPAPNPHEAKAWRWIRLADLKKDLHDRAENYTFWLKKVLPQVSSYLKINQA